MADLGLGFMALPPGSAGSGTQFGGFGDALLGLAGLAGNFFAGSTRNQAFPPQQQAPMQTGGIQPAFLGFGDPACPPRVNRITAEVRPDPCGKSPRIWMDMGSIASALPSKAFTLHAKVNRLAKKAARPARRKRGRR